MTDAIAKPEPNAFARLDERRVAVSGNPADRFEPRSYEELWTMSQALSRAGICPDALKLKPADVMLVLMQGAELGLRVVQSLKHLPVIKGRPGMSAELMRGMCQEHPDCETFELDEVSDKAATLTVKKRGWAASKTVTYTIEEAQKAGLVRDGSPWKTGPQDMLVARVTSRAARRYFPNVTSGLYTPEELQDMPAPQGDPEATRVVDQQASQLVAMLEKARVVGEQKPSISPQEAPSSPDQAETQGSVSVEEGSGSAEAPIVPEVVIEDADLAELKVQAKAKGFDTPRKLRSFCQERFGRDPETLLASQYNELAKEWGF